MSKTPVQTVRADFPHTAYRWSFRARQSCVAGVADGFEQFMEPESIEDVTGPSVHLPGAKVPSFAFAHEGAQIPSDFRCTAIALAIGLFELRCPDSGCVDGSPVFRASPWTRAALPTPRDSPPIISDRLDVAVAFAVK